MLPKLQQPALLLPTAPGTTTTLLEELINEIEAYFNVLTHPGLKPLLRLLDSIVKDYRLS
ncbi:MAG: hypothetical protein HWD59_02770 [Coxiellaceae bacterium]|nr:MAG: hypothetical protein HWD59_02770 [Coxiellaceae bacterium]